MFQSLETLRHIFVFLGTGHFSHTQSDERRNEKHENFSTVHRYFKQWKFNKPAQVQNVLFKDRYLGFCYFTEIYNTFQTWLAGSFPEYWHGPPQGSASHGFRTIAIKLGMFEDEVTYSNTSGLGVRGKSYWIAGNWELSVYWVARNTEPLVCPVYFCVNHWIQISIFPIFLVRKPEFVWSMMLLFRYHAGRKNWTSDCDKMLLS